MKNLLPLLLIAILAAAPSTLAMPMDSQISTYKTLPILVPPPHHLHLPLPPYSLTPLLSAHDAPLPLDPRIVAGPSSTSSSSSNQDSTTTATNIKQPSHITLLEHSHLSKRQHSDHENDPNPAERGWRCFKAGWGGWPDSRRGDCPKGYDRYGKGHNGSGSKVG